MPSTRATPPAENQPRLPTSRLRLEIPQLTDARAVLAIAGDPRSVEHNPSDLITDLVEAKELVGRWIRHWEEWGLGYWCVRETDRARTVGYCGLKRMTARGRPVLNLIYRFRPEAWGHGYATEAARAAIEWAGEHHPDDVVLARVRPANTASKHVALKIGLHRDPELDEDGEDGPDLAFSNR